jgi:hypothetical protein
LRNLNIDRITWNQDIVDIYEQKEEEFNDLKEENQFEIKDFVTTLMALRKFNLSNDAYEDGKEWTVISKGKSSSKKPKDDEVDMILGQIAELEQKYKEVSGTIEGQDETDLKLENFFQSQSAVLEQSTHEQLMSSSIDFNKIELSSRRSSEEATINVINSDDLVPWLRWRKNS